MQTLFAGWTWPQRKQADDEKHMDNINYVDKITNSDEWTVTASLLIEQYDLVSTYWTVTASLLIEQYDLVSTYWTVTASPAGGLIKMEDTLRHIFSVSHIYKNWQRQVLLLTWQ